MNVIALAAAATFNLVCSGQRTTDSLAGKEQEPYNTTYRIDLTAQKWCEGDCKGLQNISEVQPTQLILSDSKVDGLSQRSLLVNRIDRESGIHSIVSTYSNPRIRGSTIIMKYDGACRKLAFTGFPKFETKF